MLGVPKNNKGTMSEIINISDTSIHEEEWTKLEEFRYSIEESIRFALQDAGRPFVNLDENADHEERTIRRIYLQTQSDTTDEKSALLYQALENVLEIEKLIANNEKHLLSEKFESIFEISADAKLGIENYYDDVDDIISILNIDKGVLIYTPPETSIHIPTLITTVSAQLLTLLSKNPRLLYEISPRTFEEVIAEIFLNNGFYVELTKATRDGGKDIIAIKQNLGIQTKYIIECKRYARENKISIGLVQLLLGVKIAAAANQAILATTSSFTKDAVEFSKNHIWDLALKDYDDITTWLLPYSN